MSWTGLYRVFFGLVKFRLERLGFTGVLLGFVQSHVV